MRNWLSFSLFWPALTMQVKGDVNSRPKAASCIFLRPCGHGGAATCAAEAQPSSLTDS